MSARLRSQVLSACALLGTLELLANLLGPMDGSETTPAVRILDLTITLEDFNAFQKEICRPLTQSLSSRQKLVLGGTWLLMTLAFALLYQTRMFGPRDLIVVLATLAVACAAAQWLRARTRSRLAPAHDGVLLGAMRIELSEPRLRITSRHFETLIRWSAVRQLRETPTHLFLMIDTASGYILPKRLLGDDAAIWALRSVLTQRITIARATATRS